MREQLKENSKAHPKKDKKKVEHEKRKKLCSHIKSTTSMLMVNQKIDNHKLHNCYFVFPKPKRKKKKKAKQTNEQVRIAS